MKTRKLSLVFSLSLILLGVLIFFQYREVPAQQDSFSPARGIHTGIPEEAKQAALEGLPTFLKAVFDTKQWERFNLSSQDDLDSAVLGEPFRLFTATPADMRNRRGGQSLYDVITPTNQVYFPLIVNGEPRAFLTVDSIDGAPWKATGIGTAGLAEKWATVSKRWPSSEGFELTFVRVFQASADYVLFRSASENRGSTSSQSEGIICLQKSIDEVHDLGDAVDMQSFLNETLGEN